MTQKDSPIQNLFHVTHAKAGSTWISDILIAAFGERVFPRFGRRTEKYQWEPGKVYPAIFLPKGEFDRLDGVEGQPTFCVIRDIRDTMVSLYFSLRYTHTEVGFPHISGFREEVKHMDDREGLLHVLRTRSSDVQKTQESWLNSDIEVVRYEDLIASQGMLLLEVLERIGFHFNRSEVEAAIYQNTFEAKFGRELGQVDKTSHGRQGLPGDWKNYATDEFEQFVKEKLNDTLQKGGYSL